MKNTISETDVILNFMEDMKPHIMRAPALSFEFPAGSWAGSKNRNIADIHGGIVSGIEAKPTFASAKADYLNPDKNAGIMHYIYSSQEVEEKQVSFWKNNNISACVYLTGTSRWAIINDIDNLFERLLPLSKQEK